MTKISQEIVNRERGGFHKTVEPKDAATLIVADLSGSEPKILLGRRHARHVFMPGKFVFPGGRVDAADRDMPAAQPLAPDVERKLLAQTGFRSGREALALPLAAIRETFEETGLVIGVKAATPAGVPAGPWEQFVASGFVPDPAPIRFVARAITPPGFVRRFDARFFCVDAGAIAHRRENVVHADAELVELTWLPIFEALKLDLPVVTELVLEELEDRLRLGNRADLPVPFFATRDGEFTRELIE